MKVLLERERRQPGTVLDQTFIAEHTTASTTLAAASARASTGTRSSSSERHLRATQIDEAGRRCSRARERIIVCWAMGLTQHSNAVATIQEIVNLLLLRGNIGKPGAGVCPVRGHSNVQGDRTMGIWERPRRQFLDALEREFGFEPPREHGFDTVEAIQAMHDGRVEVFFAHGRQLPLAPRPTPTLHRGGARRCALTVQVSTKLNRSHLVTGRAGADPALPRPHRARPPGRRRAVRHRRGLDGRGARRRRAAWRRRRATLLSELAIVAGLATRACSAPDRRADWADARGRLRPHPRPHRARRARASSDFNERVARAGRLHLPNAARDDDASRRRHGKARFTVNHAGADRAARRASCC